MRDGYKKGWAGRRERTGVGKLGAGMRKDGRRAVGRCEAGVNRQASTRKGAGRDEMGWKRGRMGAGKGGMRREWNAREMKREGAGPVGALDWKVRCKGGRKGTEMRRGGINGRGWETGNKRCRSTDVSWRASSRGSSRRKKHGSARVPSALCSRTHPTLFRISYNFAFSNPVQLPKCDCSAIIRTNCFCLSVIESR